MIPMRREAFEDYLATLLRETGNRPEERRRPCRAQAEDIARTMYANRCIPHLPETEEER